MKSKINKVGKIFSFQLNKKHVIIGLTVLAIIIAAITFLVITTNKLTPMEIQAVEVLTDYKARLKNPNSMQVFEIRYKESYNKNNELYYKFYIDCAGQNGFGGNTRSIVYYTVDKDDNISYIGDDDMANRTITKYTSDIDVLKITVAKLIQKEWNELEEQKDNKLDAEKIFKKVE